MKLKDEFPVDHKLATVYRYGSGFCGIVLLVFAGLGFADGLTSFDTDAEVAGMSSNLALSIISVVFGVALIVGAFVGGNFASTLNMAVGTLFLLSGFYHIFAIGRGPNPFDFGVTNVYFSFLMGLVILTFGMYGRVSSKLSHDNPYWVRRHPREAARERLASRRAALEGGSRGSTALPKGSGPRHRPA
ncbi:DUF4383 domain-containing protein [Streptomyces sp. NPDC060194]|uniref:DUF4383 domain-containing protein n=1 Tax=Streptomyces sp. NPDC060194 TaxID=3347069 RepID=UPI00365E56D1